MTKREKKEHEERLAQFVRKYRVRTEQGRLVLYKSVTKDLSSWYTRYSRKSKFAKKGVYAVGKEVTIGSWCRDPRQSCGAGLHVSTRSFAQEFHTGGVILKVLVRPEDVVCVPNDPRSKIRVKRFYVHSIVSGKPSAQ